MAEQFTWTSDYSVNVKLFDDQHKKLIDFMNKLYGMLVEANSKEEITKSFQEIMGLANEHFSTEEKYFEQYQYPGAEEHIKHHRAIVTEIEDIRAHNDQDEIALGFKLLDLMEDWLIVHMNTMDKKYSFWFNEHGVF